MIHRFFATLVTGLFVLGGLVTAAPPAAFTTSVLDGARDDFAASVVRAPDALYVAGRSASKTIGGWPVATGGVPEAAVLARYSLSGDLDWVSALPGDAGATAAATAVTPQGSIYVAGTYVRAADSQMLVAKYDAEGGISWFREFGGTGGEAANDVAAAANGGVFVVGKTFSQEFKGRPTRFGSAVLLHVSSSGLLKWFRVLPPGDAYSTPRLVATPDGGVVVANERTSAPSVSAVAVRRFSSQGTLEWTAPMPAGGHGRVLDLASHRSGAFLLWSHSDGSSEGFRVTRISWDGTRGRTVHVETPSGYEFFRPTSLAVARDRSVVVGGGAVKAGNGSTTNRTNGLLATYTAGKLVSARVIGASEKWDEVASLSIAGDQGYFAMNSNGQQPGLRKPKQVGIVVGGFNP